MATIYLTGQQQDGTTALAGAASLPLREVLRLTKGRDHTIRLNLLDEAGNPLKFATFTSVTFTVKASTSDLTKALTATATADDLRGANWCLISVPATALRNLSTTRYVYDIAGVKGGETFTLIGTSALILSPSVG
jgi:hypothetical protein